MEALTNQPRQMNKENAKQFIPLVQALADGKTIQVLSAGVWLDVESVDFSGLPDYFRIKPGPRRWWINIHKRDGNTCQIPFISREEADKFAHGMLSGNRIECVEVVEVVK